MNLGPNGCLPDSGSQRAHPTYQKSLPPAEGEWPMDHNLVLMTSCKTVMKKEQGIGMTYTRMGLPSDFSRQVEKPC